MRPIGSFLCGAVLTALTVIWIHVGAVAVGASVYALPEVLLFVVIGVALGTRAAARSKDPAQPAFVLLVSAGLLFMQTSFWPNVPASIAVMGQGVHNFRLGEAVRGLHLAMMLLPFSFLFATLEALSAVFLLGGIVGAFLAVLVLIPQTGSEMSLRWITVALIAGWSPARMRSRSASAPGACPPRFGASDSPASKPPSRRRAL
jgi:hypothetical protein